MFRKICPKEDREEGRSSRLLRGPTWGKLCGTRNFDIFVCEKQMCPSAPLHSKDDTSK